MHFAMLVVQHWVCVIHQCFDKGSGHNPACQTPWWNKAIFLLHQTVIPSKTAVNSHPRRTLRTGTVNDINLRMTQFWKTLHTVLLLTYHLAAQVSHSHVRQAKMWWIRKVWLHALKWANCESLSPNHQHFSPGLWSGLYCLILHHIEWKGQKTLTVQQPPHLSTISIICTHRPFRLCCSTMPLFA